MRHSPQRARDHLSNLGDCDDGNMWSQAGYVEDAYEELLAENEQLRKALKMVLANSDPLPPDGIDIHVAAQRTLDPGMGYD